MDKEEIFKGDLNTDRIKVYRALAEYYNISVDTVQGIFNAGALWILSIKSTDEKQ